MTKRQKAEKAVVRAAMRLFGAWEAWDNSDIGEGRGGSPLEYLDEEMMASEEALHRSCARLAKMRGKR